MSETNRPITPDTAEGEGLAQRLIDQVAALQKRIDKADRRIRIERALADAQAADVQAAADELEQEVTADTTGDLPAQVRRLKRNKPGYFKAPSTTSEGATSLPAADPHRSDPQLMVLRDKASKGDRASLLLYLRARRSKA